MERGTTLFLKVTLLLLGIPVLALCAVGLPSIASNMAEEYEGSAVYPLFGIIYATAIPYFTALYQSFRLLNYIDHNIAFSERSVTALKKIKYSAIAFSVLYVGSLPFLYLIADQDDAPGLIVIGMVLVFGGMVIAFFAAVLERLLKNAIDIKSENDLTV
ncbi:DUF2975 domain-containing protein [Paenibacillus kobensis]|uniref:DUF2975 domain-containing protein n=1 Tax=Paenibacillus kobensis TaxID=59841 RepID=UPI000FDC9CD5|nr:DUF2975 domain-containing protein [Paenibacillus kobensis]